MAKQKNSLTQQQVLKQKLSHQNIQLFKMMELNLLQFDQKVKEEIEVNPALDSLDSYDVKNAELSIDQVTSYSPQTDNTSNKEINEEFLSKKLQSEASQDLNNYQNSKNFSNDYNSDDQDRDLYLPVEDNESFVGNLLNQLKYNNLSDKQLIIGEFIIGNLDDDGYLRRNLSNIVDDLSFRQNIHTTEEEVKIVLENIQDLDPPGIGASSLQECLILQLERKKYTKNTQLAIDVVTKYFDLYTKRNYGRIATKLKISDLEFDLVNKEILQLNPKPTEKNLNEEILGRYIIPDFLVYSQDNKIELELHSYNQPNLTISPDFVEMLKRLKDQKKKSKTEKEAQDYISDNIMKANLFISLVKERQETMIIIMNSILQLQKKFFQTGQEEDLKPMVLRHIAERTNFDISTVSRVTNSKYVQTEFGVYSLKFFFSEGMISDQGEEISNRTIMKKLEEIVNTEDKSEPLSDEQLTQELKKQGFNIARRTTAKYRENLSIPPKHLRKISIKS